MEFLFGGVIPLFGSLLDFMIMGYFREFSSVCSVEIYRANTSLILTGPTIYTTRLVGVAWAGIKFLVLSFFPPLFPS